MISDDAGYIQFMDFLRQRGEAIISSLYIPKESRCRSLLTKPFNELYTKYVSDHSTQSTSIAACDSSQFIRELYNGKTIFIIRAFTEVGDRTYSSFISEITHVDKDSLRNFSILIMEHAEHLSMLRMLENESPDFLLVDGSLIGRLSHRSDIIEAEGYENFMTEYFDVLGKLLEKAYERGVKLIFIAKTSESTSFMKRMTEMTGDEYQNEFCPGITDHLIVKSLAEFPGYTHPTDTRIKLGPQRIREGYVVKTFHVLPDMRDVPMKVDVLEKADRNDNEIIPHDVLSLIFGGYAGLKVHNIWLTKVDRRVRISRQEAENVFMRIFEDTIGINMAETRGERRARIRI